MLNPANPAGNKPIETAINSWTTSAQSDKKLKESTEKTFLQALNKIDNKDIKTYITRQLEILRGVKSVAKVTEESSKKSDKTATQDAKKLPVLSVDELKQLGFKPLFDGKSLKGWKGLVGNPLTRAAMSKRELKKAQKIADKKAAASWIVEDGVLIFTGKGDNLCTVKEYGDFEMYVDWKLFPGEEPDGGIYLRGAPQVQIWDTARVKVGAQVLAVIFSPKKNLTILFSGLNSSLHREPIMVWASAPRWKATPLTWEWNYRY